MNLKIETQFFLAPDSVSVLEKLDIEAEYEMTDCKLADVTFYQIENIMPYSENGVEYCVIQSGGMNYVVNDSYNYIKMQIEKQLK
jgi:hypothetical protein